MNQPIIRAPQSAPATALATRLLRVATLALAAACPSLAFAALPSSAPPLPAPTGAVVYVSTAAELQNAVASLASNTTIIVRRGTYRLTRTLYVRRATNVGIRGETNNPADVVIMGPGRDVWNADVPSGIWSDTSKVLVANLTLRDFYQHGIILNAGAQEPRVYNVRITEIGSQLLKSNPDGTGGGVNFGIVEYSTFDFATTSRDDYVKGVDVHTGRGWIIRHNLFRNIRSVVGLAGPAVLIWNSSRDTVTEGNTFINCHRGIYYGVMDRTPDDHTGGIIRNNFFVRLPGQSGDVGITVVDSPGTKILNNTIILSGTYRAAIEYRFAGTRGVVIMNNLMDASIWQRDGATAQVTNNVTNAAAGLFVNLSAGDLHLLPTATAAIDRGIATPDVTVDWDRQSRSSGAAPDLGADEYHAPPPTAPPTVTIGGTIRNGGGQALGNVAVALSGSAAATVVTGSDGRFAFPSLTSGGTYTVTPSGSGWTFTPASRTFSNVTTGQTGDFVGAAVAQPVSLRVAEDTFVRDGLFHLSFYGHTASLQVSRSSTTNHTRHIYVKYDVSSVGAISGARLRFFGQMSGTTTPSVLVGVHPVANVTWSEYALTWGTRPPAGARLAAFTVSGTTPRWYEVDVTAHVRAEQLAGRNVFALALIADANSSTFPVFNSKEAAANHPVLVVW
jgi:hypothetical protein